MKVNLLIATLFVASMSLNAQNRPILQPGDKYASDDSISNIEAYFRGKTQGLADRANQLRHGNKGERNAEIGDLQRELQDINMLSSENLGKYRVGTTQDKISALKKIHTYLANRENAILAEIRDMERDQVKLKANQRLLGRRAGLQQEHGHVRDLIADVQNKLRNLGGVQPQGGIVSVGSRSGTGVHPMNQR